VPKRPFQIGDQVIFTKSKHSLAPGPRAREVMPEAGGDGYSYLVEKLWVVEDRSSDGRLVLRTRRGKRHEVSERDQRLRRANLWERFRFRGRFPDGTEPDEDEAGS
jgi:hypothetical protein